MIKFKEKIMADMEEFKYLDSNGQNKSTGHYDVTQTMKVLMMHTS